MMLKHASSLLSETSAFFASDKERVSKSEPISDIIRTASSSVFQTHSLFAPVLELLLFKPEKEDDEDFRDTSRTPKLSPARRLSSSFMIWRNSQVCVSDAPMRTPMLIRSRRFLSATRRFKRLDHNAVVLMRLCKSPG